MAWSARREKLLALLVLGPAQVSAQDPSASPWQQLIAGHCAECHDAETRKGGLDLFAREHAEPVVWLTTVATVRDRVRAGEMPPNDAEPLPAAVRAQLLAFCGDTLAREVPRLPTAPLGVTVRRLSRVEWQNSVRDLFGVGTELARAFPADDLGYGFDNIGDALSFSTLHLEKYLAAAGDVAAQVFHGEDPSAPAVQHFEAERMQVVGDRGINQDAEVATLYAAGTLAATVDLPRAGDYRVRVMAGADQAGDEPARLTVAVGGQQLQRFDVPHRDSRTLQVGAQLRGGSQRIELSFVNDYFEPDNPDPQRRDRNLRIDWLEVEGPIDARPTPAQQAWLTAADRPKGQPAARLRALVRALLPRVWRRPVSDAEVLRSAGVGIAAMATGEPLHVAMQQVLTAALSSPHFLFRIEPQPGSRGNVIRPVPGPALAVRLSFFLWSSTPDDELRQLGQDGRLLAKDVLTAQVQRLLADPRAEALASNFAAQWLELRALDDLAPDPARFPGFDAPLRTSLRREAELLFLAVLRDRLDVRTLLDSDFTHVDRTLAGFYGLEGEFDASFRRLPLPPAQRERGGILGMASMHAITANPTRTSPVKRGKWILENVLGQPPPPPPPGNDSLADEQAAKTPAGLREQLALHRADKKCASCHTRMDALGLALERYDAIGRPRIRDDRGGAIDASFELPDGRRFDGLSGLKTALRDDPAFERTLARRLFVYAVGREPSAAERLRLEREVELRRERDAVTLPDLVLTIVRSDAFLLRRVGE